MGDILARLSPGQLKACQLSLKLIDDKILELGLIKRGHKHLWNELAAQYGIADKKLELDYTTGLIMERTQPEKVDGKETPKEIKEENDG
jgi:hypothetical protein